MAFGCECTGVNELLLCMAYSSWQREDKSRASEFEEKWHLGCARVHQNVRGMTRGRMCFVRKKGRI